MTQEKMQGRPSLAIVDSNTLAMLGLKHLLKNVIPIMTIDVYSSFAELQANRPDHYFHFFVAMDIVMANQDFFCERQRKTIVLTSVPASTIKLQTTIFHALCVNQPEGMLVRQLLLLQQHGHGGGRNMPPMPQVLQQKVLSDRETEVLALVVQGYINKEIAERLNIALSTVVTHRKNIMDKLGLKSVSALTIYAVMHSLVDINKI